MKQHRLVCALLVAMALFAGCKGESPTAPSPAPPGSGTPGGSTPPTSATLTVTVSNPTPAAGSTTIITATVTQGGQPVPNGTAVEFSTNLGTFIDTGVRTTIRTTTNGVATATLTSGAPGTATITVVVGNVSQNAVVTFGATPTGPPPPASTTPTISSVTPNVGTPAGNQLITITGTNFRQPARVTFDFGNGRAPVEAFIASLTPTQIQVFTPAVNLAPGEVAAATIRVFVDAGLPTEQVATAQFTFMPDVVTPNIVTISPDSGPAVGGTRVTIFGSGFQDPAQVFFGDSGPPVWVQAQVINVTFDQIIAISPSARDIALQTTGPVDVRVVNIKSATEDVSDNVFRYAPTLSISGVTPNQASAVGGDTIVIDGHGFEGPVGVLLAGVQADVINVTGTQLIVRTSGLASPCTAVVGTVIVTNLNTGDSTSSLNDLGPFDPGFTYIAVTPQILSITSAGPIVPGSSISVTVIDPGVGINGTGIVRFTVNGVAITPSPNLITNGVGQQVFTLAIPTTGFTFPTVPCTTATNTPGTQLGPVQVNIVFTNLTTGCTTTLTQGLTVQPPGANPCLQPPTPVVTTPAGGACAIPPAASVAGAPQTTTAPITIMNAANSQPLNITGVTVTGANAAEFSVAPTSAMGVQGGASTNFTLTFDPTTAGAKTANVNFTTNSPATPTVTVCVTATANP